MHSRYLLRPMARQHLIFSVNMLTESFPFRIMSLFKNHLLKRSITIGIWNYEPVDSRLILRWQVGFSIFLSTIHNGTCVYVSLGVFYSWLFSHIPHLHDVEVEIWNHKAQKLKSFIHDNTVPSIKNGTIYLIYTQ